MLQPTLQVATHSHPSPLNIKTRPLFGYARVWSGWRLPADWLIVIAGWLADWLAEQAGWSGVGGGGGDTSRVAMQANGTKA